MRTQQTHTAFALFRAARSAIFPCFSRLLFSFLPFFISSFCLVCVFVKLHVSVANGGAAVAWWLVVVVVVGASARDFVAWEDGCTRPVVLQPLQPQHRPSATSSSFHIPSHLFALFKRKSCITLLKLFPFSLCHRSAIPSLYNCNFKWQKIEMDYRQLLMSQANALAAAGCYGVSPSSAAAASTGA